jgi:hypothetical protein
LIGSLEYREKDAGAEIVFVAAPSSAARKDEVLGAAAVGACLVGGE